MLVTYTSKSEKLGSAKLGVFVIFAILSPQSHVGLSPMITGTDHGWRSHT